MSSGSYRHRLTGTRPALRYAPSPRVRPTARVTWTTPTTTRPSSQPQQQPQQQQPSSSSAPQATPPRAAQPPPSTRTVSSGPPRQRSTGHVSSNLAPPWPWNPEETDLIHAGYRPAYPPPSAAPKLDASTEPARASTSAPNPQTTTKLKPKPTPKKMAEPRARAARHKGQMNFASELRLLLLAYGDPSPHPSFPSEPLPETVRVLDEIVTDFVLEMCHGAAQYASYSRRQKIKVDDFRFALRRDPNKLGRVQELLRMERELKEARKAFDQNDDQVGNLKDAAAAAAAKKGAGGGGAAAAAVGAGDEDFGAAESVDGRKSKGKGKRSAAARRDSDVTEEGSVTAGVAKKRKVGGG
ncbi:putative transcription initiation factor TFIID subunit 13 [Aspergillus aculeatinus CBS 121060]|uniref:TFIID-18kDa-domain-containing protein n=1 Tax=Aspergillus aculeatinus CBS 121060 TaxID=1448322 RepID=A0ACD1GUI4_9EURO|nr:TFIID-18kDa-domain-containing protein [Aspergillus aculeatinus CBS 121060]RAH64936.1 TFIID-18kDa-domain-containing protein [Aspergillus aculeatinus CBS 121060]